MRRIIIDKFNPVRSAKAKLIESNDPVPNPAFELKATPSVNNTIPPTY